MITIADNIGSITVILLIVSQFVMFIVNALLKLNLPLEQLWLPMFLFVVFIVLGSIMMWRG
jgi:hypothetical protein